MCKYEKRIAESIGDAPITILRQSNFSDKKLQSKLVVLRSQIDYAFKLNDHKAIELFQIQEKITIQTRLYKNCTNKIEKRKDFEYYKKEALIRLKQLWGNDYDKLWLMLDNKNDEDYERLKQNFEKNKEEIFEKAIYYESMKEYFKKVYSLEIIDLYE